MTKPLLRYLGLLLNRAAQGSIILTDRLTVLIVPFATLIVWLFGARMTNSITETLALGTAVAVLIVVILRLVAASYWLWSDDQAEKQKLEKLLNRPYQRQREAAAEYVAKLRSELSDTLAKQVAISELYLHKGHEFEPISKQLAIDQITVARRCRELINALSYDVPLRVAAYNLSVLASRIAYNSVAGEDTKDLFSQLNAMKKVTFRLLHKNDDGPLGELLSMLEVQNINEGNSKENETFDDDVMIEGSAEDKLAWVKSQIQDPVLLSELRAHIKRENLQND